MFISLIKANSPMTYHYIRAVGILLLSPFSCLAQDSVFDLSLAQLSQVSVSVSSKVELPLQLSPASVIAYSRN